MARAPSLTAQPANEAAALLQRLGFTILMIVMPVAALYARRAVVVLAPVGICLLIIAAMIDGGPRHPRDELRSVVLTTGGLAAITMLAWCALSVIWTPFTAPASERLLNLVGIVVITLAGYLALPDRMRSANLYILPVGVAVSALAALGTTLFDGAAVKTDQDSQNLERGLIVLVMLLWPAVAWLRSRSRDLEALLLALVVGLATLLAPSLLPLEGLAAGVVVFTIVAASPRHGAKIIAVIMASLLLLAPLLPFVLKPLAMTLLGAKNPATASLEAWRSVVLDEPVRLITGHGFETALRGRFVGLLPLQSPNTLLFEIWYELGLVGAVAGAIALYAAVRGSGERVTPLVPGMVAAFASAFALACLGIGSAQAWWFTALAIVVLIFVAIERGQFRTTRPKAIFNRLR